MITCKVVLAEGKLVLTRYITLVPDWGGHEMINRAVQKKNKVPLYEKNLIISPLWALNYFLKPSENFRGEMVHLLTVHM